LKVTPGYIIDIPVAVGQEFSAEQVNEKNLNKCLLDSSPRCLQLTFGDCSSFGFRLGWDQCYGQLMFENTVRALSLNLAWINVRFTPKILLNFHGWGCEK